MRLRVTAEQLLHWNLKGRHGAASRLHEDVLAAAFGSLLSATVGEDMPKPAGGVVPDLAVAERLLLRLSQVIVCPERLYALGLATGRDTERLRRAVLALEATVAGTGPVAGRPVEDCFQAAAAARSHALILDLVEPYQTLEIVAAGFLPRTRAWTLGRTVRLLATQPRARLLGQLRSFGRTLQPDVEGARRAASRWMDAMAPGGGPSPDWMLHQLSWSSARGMLESAASQAQASGDAALPHSRARREAAARLRRVSRARALVEWLHACAVHLPRAAWWEHRAVRALEGAAARVGLPRRTATYHELSEAVKQDA